MTIKLKYTLLPAISDYTLTYGDEIITYKVIRSSRTRSLEITINPFGEVTVRAPAHVDTAEVRRLVDAKARWIATKLNRYNGRFSVKPAHRQYLPGEIHYYLGEAYELVVTGAASDSVVAHNARLIVSTRYPGNELLTKHILNTWYLLEAQKIIGAKMVDLFDAFNIYSLNRPTCSVVTMKGKWGQCGTKGRIKLNRELIKLPIGCIDYVIIHELCHLKEHNHSERFYALLAKHFPDWKLWRGRLKRLSS